MSSFPTFAASAMIGSEKHRLPLPPTKRQRAWLPIAITAISTLQKAATKRWRRSCVIMLPIVSGVPMAAGLPWRIAAPMCASSMLPSARSFKTDKGWGTVTS
ncbi:hypothetical protein D3C87_1669830 [compost metagenome]